MGVMLSAAFALTNCTSEMDHPVQAPSAEGAFEIIAKTADTKTVNDGMYTLWEGGDTINVFHAAAGSEDYVNDGMFTIAEADVEDGRFTGELGAAVEADGTYDWYAFFPYTKQKESPADAANGYAYIGHSKGLNQTGYDNMGALRGSVCPLYGVAKAVAGDKVPGMTMQHLSSAVAVQITNDNDEPLTVKTVSFTAPEAIVGSFYMTFADGEPTYAESGATYVNSTAVVNVKEGTALAKGEFATVYIAIKPFTAAAEDDLTLTVNGYEKTLTMTNDVTFHAGKIKTLKFKYDYVEVIDGDKIEWTSSSDWTGIGENEISLTSGDYSVVINKQSGATNPTVNANYNDCRAYAMNTVTLTHSSKNITSLVFYLSAQGLKRLTDITPSSGEITIDTENGQVVWTGDAASVTLTVGEKAVHGTDDASKAGQLCFDYIVAKTGGTAVTPDPEPDPSEPTAVTIAEFNAAEDGGVYELSGTITEIYEAYTEQYNNVSFYIEDATGRTLIYRMSCEGVADPTAITVGDDITVQGTKTTYNGSAQMAQGGKYISHTDKAAPEQGEVQVVTVAEFLEAAESSTAVYELAGIITRITVPYSSEYNNISFNISDETGEVTIFRMSCEGVADPYSLTVGDEITVQGTKTTYNGSAQMAQGGKYINHIDKEAPAPEEGTFELSFADKANRTSYSTEEQVWEQNGIIVTNNKAASTSNVGDYAAPARFYKSSSLKIEKAGMSKIVFCLNSAKPASGLTDSINDSNVSVSVSGYDVTIIFTKAVDVFEIASLANQIRVDILRVYTN